MTTVIFFNEDQPSHQCAVFLLQMFLPEDKKLAFLTVWEHRDSASPLNIIEMINLTRQTYLKDLFSWVFLNSDVGQVVNVYTVRALHLDSAEYPKINQIVASDSRMSPVQFVAALLREYPRNRLQEKYLDIIYMYQDYFSQHPSMRNIRAVNRLRELSPRPLNFSCHHEALFGKQGLSVDLLSVQGINVTSFQRSMIMEHIQRTSQLKNRGALRIACVEYPVSEPSVHIYLAETYPHADITLVHIYNHKQGVREYSICAQKDNFALDSIPKQLNVDYIGDSTAIRFSIFQEDKNLVLKAISKSQLQ